MTCETTRDWLLDPEAPAPAGAAEHLASCAGCRAYRQEVADLGRRWRELPLSPRAEVSKQAFLARLGNAVQPAKPVPPKPHRHLFRWAVAAMLFVGVGGGLLLFWPSDKVVEAHPDVLDQLIDWNLDLSEAPSPHERKKIYHAKHDVLKRALKQSQLEGKEKELGERLLANGAWMADNLDPVEELNRFHDVADDLLDGVNRAGPDAGKSDRMARQFGKVSARGIDRNIERVKSDKLVDPDGRVKFNKFLRQDAAMAERVRDMLERGPDLTKKELRHALELSNKRHKHKKNPAAPHEAGAEALNP